VIKRVSRTSRHYPKGILKCSVCSVIPCTFVVLFVQRTSGGPPTYVRTRDRDVRPVDLAYIRLLRTNVLLLFSKGSRCG
jgi:hypothetical protein